MVGDLGEKLLVAVEGLLLRCLHGRAHVLRQEALLIHRHVDDEGLALVLEVGGELGEYGDKTRGIIVVLLQLVRDHQVDVE